MSEQTPNSEVERLRQKERERDVAVGALQDIAGSRPSDAAGRLLRARARDALDQLDVSYRRAE